MDSVVVRKARIDELDWINCHYAEIEFVPSTEDELIVIAEVNGERAGIGRVVTINEEVGELGGIFVLPNFRGQSVAGNIVDTLISEASYPVLYCIPFAHLELFYRSHGFDSVKECNLVPEAILKKVNWCLDQYEEEVRLLVRFT